jgi:hypothetical protein
VNKSISQIQSEQSLDLFFRHFFFLELRGALEAVTTMTTCSFMSVCPTPYYVHKYFTNSIRGIILFVQMTLFVLEKQGALGGVTPAISNP